MKKVLITLTTLIVGIMIFTLINDLNNSKAVVANMEETQSSLSLDKKDFETYVERYAEETQFKFSSDEKVNSAELRRYIADTDRFLEMLKDTEGEDLYAKKIEKLKELLTAREFSQVVELLNTPQPGDDNFVGPIVNS